MFAPLTDELRRVTEAIKLSTPHFMDYVRRYVEAKEMEAESLVILATEVRNFRVEREHDAWKERTKSNG